MDRCWIIAPRQKQKKTHNKGLIRKSQKSWESDCLDFKHYFHHMLTIKSWRNDNLCINKEYLHPSVIISKFLYKQNFFFFSFLPKDQKKGNTETQIINFQFLISFLNIVPWIYIKSGKNNNLPYAVACSGIYISQMIIIKL